VGEPVKREDGAHAVPTVSAPSLALSPLPTLAWPGFPSWLRKQNHT
jgi:hypothetical protein